MTKKTTEDAASSPLKSKISIRRIEGDDTNVDVSLRFSCDPKVIGEGRAADVWKGIALILRGLMEDAEIDEFMRQWKEAGFVSKKAKGRSKAK